MRAIYCQKIRDGQYDSEKALAMKPELLSCKVTEIIGAGSFFNQANEFIQRHHNALPDTNSTIEEKAGITKIGETFGFYSTLATICNGDYTKMETYLHQWSAADFYHLTKYLSWRQDADKRYRDIMSRKK